MADESTHVATGEKRRGRPSSASGAATRQRIVIAAQERFGELGYRGLSVERLARDLDVDARSIYHYFPSKRALFQAASVDALEVYSSQVATRVLVHEDLRGRLHAFVDLYRWLFRERRHLLSFLSVMLVESVTDARTLAPPGAAGSGAVGGDLTRVGQALQAANLLLAEQAVERGELSPDIGGASAAALLEMFGMGLGMASLDPAAPFLSVLDALDLLVDGTLLT